MKKTTHPPLKRSPQFACKLVTSSHHKGRHMSYASPEIEVINLNNRDIITDSQNQGPDETTKIDNPGGIWDLNNNA